MITKFDKNIARAIGPQILAALADFAKERDLTVTDKGGSFTDTALTVRIEFAVRQTADGLSREQAEFNRLCEMFYCKPEDFKKPLFVNGQNYLLIGFEPGRSKFCIRTRRIADHKTILFGENILKQIGRGLEIAMATKDSDVA